jgi:hypothetical protein
VVTLTNPLLEGEDLTYAAVIEPKHEQRDRAPDRGDRAQIEAQREDGCQRGRGGTAVVLP